MDFIVASYEHIDKMCEITEQAKRQLRGLGSINGRRDILPEKCGYRMRKRAVHISQWRMERLREYLHFRRLQIHLMRRLTGSG